ncbi:MAG: serine hydrolase domain-containing protein [Planctomycetales bacterium]
MKRPLSIVAVLLASFTVSDSVYRLASTAVAQTASNDREGATNKKLLTERFGEQQFRPEGSFVLTVGMKLPELEWRSPELVATVVNRHAIPTRWFNERFEEVEVAAKTGRYYAYGEAPTPNGPPLRRAMTCCCLPPSVDLKLLAENHKGQPVPESHKDGQRSPVDAVIDWWRTTEEGAVELAALFEAGDATEAVRPGQRQMENATRHVLLKRKLMGLEDKPLLIPKPRNLNDKPAPVLRSGSLADAGLSESEIQEIESSLDDWYAASQEPMGVVIARNGVIALAKGYGTLEDKPVTVDTPMLLHSAMKPLIGVQLATYVDRGFLKLDEPIGKHLPDFNTPRDQNLTYRAAHVHATGIHFPWELAFRRLFYFHTWHESLIAHCRRQWEPGARHRYGVVGIILSVRSLELLRGMNYWDAMERDIYQPLGIRNVLPGGTGFSAENMARIGVLLDNHGQYGQWELFSEDTYQALLPTSLKPYFPAVDMQYGIGLRPSGYLGPGGYGHGGGCGTQLVVNPRTHTVFAMVRNDRGLDYSKHLSKVVSLVRDATIK